ncbi:hypothetical protein ACLBVR_29325, partial [Pseudomonas aeruginosa]
MPSRITLNANGGPEVLRLEQVQAQQPGPGEVWLEQAAAFRVLDAEGAH